MIVNDGSTDRTGEIIDEARGGIRGYGQCIGQIADIANGAPGSSRHFTHGFDPLSCQRLGVHVASWTVTLSLSPGTSRRRLSKFRQTPETLGSAAAIFIISKTAKKILETQPMFHVRGGVKIFRRACWEDIGGLWIGPGSDTVDEVKANMLGWTTMSFPDLEMIHHRPTGASWGRWGGLVKDGRIDYVYGSHPAFLSCEIGGTPRSATLRHRFSRVAIRVHGGLFQRIPAVDDP